MVYEDVVNQGWILPRKSRYTIADFKKLLKIGYTVKTARWICICSATYYNTEWSHSIDSRERLEIQYPGYVQPRVDEWRWK